MVVDGVPYYVVSYDTEIRRKEMNTILRDLIRKTENIRSVLIEFILRKHDIKIIHQRLRARIKC